MNMNRRSTFIPAAIYAGNDLSPTTLRRSFQPLDHHSYLAMIENGRTLVRSTYLIVLVCFLVYIPYWTSELTRYEWSHKWKDIYFLSHILKPFCYLATNEKYRYHILAILQCKPFRLLPNLLRRKSRVLRMRNSSIYNQVDKPDFR